MGREGTRGLNFKGAPLKQNPPVGFGDQTPKMGFSEKDLVRVFPPPSVSYIFLGGSKNPPGKHRWRSPLSWELVCHGPLLDHVFGFVKDLTVVLRNSRSPRVECFGILVVMGRNLLVPLGCMFFWRFERSGCDECY